MNAMQAAMLKAGLITESAIVKVNKKQKPKSKDRKGKSK